MADELQALAEKIEILRRDLRDSGHFNLVAEVCFWKSVVIDFDCTKER